MAGSNEDWSAFLCNVHKVRGKSFSFVGKVKRKVLFMGEMRIKHRPPLKSETIEMKKGGCNLLGDGFNRLFAHT